MEARNAAWEKTDPGPAGSEVIGAGVSSGTLAVELIRSATERVLAVHGISSQRKLWTEALS